MQHGYSKMKDLERRNDQEGLTKRRDNKEGFRLEIMGTHELMQVFVSRENQLPQPGVITSISTHLTYSQLLITFHPRIPLE